MLAPRKSLMLFYCIYHGQVRNVYSVITNHIEDQDTPQNHKLITIAVYSLVISRLIAFFF